MPQSQELFKSLEKQIVNASDVSANPKALEGISIQIPNTGLSRVTTQNQKPFKTYELDIQSYLKDSNAYGNIYFARYFDWQGIVRESWFTECLCTGNMFELEGAFVTKSASMEYLKEVFPFQKLTFLINAKNVRSVSLEIHFSIFEKTLQKLMGKGKQTLVFVNKSKKPTKIPPAILAEIQKYELE